MKALIRKDKNGYWKARFDGYNEWFMTFEAADIWVRKTMKRYYKESVAFSILGDIGVNLLSCRERELVDKLIKNRCKGITKKQYGWLRGIHERQQREW